MKNFITSLLTLLLILFLQQMAFSQIDYSGELSRTLKLPNSPEASSFTKYGNTSVSMYTGTPNISVPIYTYEGLELNLPINLTYDASGIKVEQTSGFVGLGWNLNMGGRISRIQNGLVDDYLHSNHAYSTINQSDVRLKMLEYIDDNIEFTGGQKIIQYYEFLDQVNKNYIDIEPDFYSLNVLGLNTTIVFDIATNQPKSLTNPNLKIEVTRTQESVFNPYIISWKITDEQGMIYHFEQAEKRKFQAETNAPEAITQATDREYNSSWVLTKLESPNKRDTYEFFYYETGYFEQELPSSNISQVSNNISPTMPNNNNLPSSETRISTLSNQSTRLYMSSIVHNNKTIITSNLTNRSDVNPEVKKLSNLTINKQNENGAHLNFQFNYTYFGTTNEVAPWPSNRKSIRLKLDAIDIKNSENNMFQSYGFEYVSPSTVTFTNSKSQDYLGYFNNRSNSVLYPEYTLNADNNPNNQFHFTGADRGINTSVSQSGMLKRITYPTGGYTEFDFEPHDISKNVTTTSDVTYKNASIGSTGPSDLYYDDDGNLCDDKFINGGSSPQADLPGVEFGKFRINNPLPPGGPFYFDYSGNGGEFEIFIEALYDSDNPNSFFDEDTQTTIYPPSTYTGSVPRNRCDYPSSYPELTQIANISIYDSSTDNVPISLEAGWYFYLILADDHDEENVETSSGFRIYRNEDITSIQTIQKAGFRVKKIRDYTREGHKALEKKYVYRQNVESNFSSGVELFKPKFSYLSTYQKYVASLGDYVEEQILNRNSTAFGNSTQPHVVYNKVYEIIKDFNNADLLSNGYTEYNFNVGIDGLSNTRSLPPFTNQFVSNYEAGKPNESKVFNSSQEKLASEQTTYQSNNFYYQQGISLINRSENRYKYVSSFLDQDTGIYSVVLLDPCWQCFSGGNEGNSTTCSPVAHCPVQCNVEAPSCIFDMSYGPLDLYRYTIRGDIGQPISVEKKQYFFEDNAPTLMTSSTNYRYDDQTYLLKEMENTNSEGEVNLVKYYRPSDMPDYVYNIMQSANRLTDEVKVESFVDGTLMGTRKNNYHQIAGGGFQVISVETRKGDDLSNGLDLQLRYRYDATDGNIIEYWRGLGIKTTLIWGYDNKYPIAKIENASYEDVQAYITNIKSASNLDDDRTIDTIDTSGNSDYQGSEGALRELLDDLRSVFPSAKITTYTYDPLIGMTSMTDPKGYVMYYHYDENNRLEYVKDKDGHLINKNEYNYREEN